MTAKCWGNKTNWCLRWIQTVTASLPGLSTATRNRWWNNFRLNTFSGSPQNYPVKLEALADEVFSNQMYNGYRNYLENEVLSADPLKLVELLYRGAIDSIHSARQHLAKRAIRPRSQAITKAQLIILELTDSLDAERDPNLAQQLARLYEYVGHLLVEANTRQQDAPLAEADQLLTTLLEAWLEIRQPGSVNILEPAGAIRYAS